MCSGHLSSYQRYQVHHKGLHRIYSGRSQKVRRMIWHQLCFLDMRTCEATGPRPQIRAEDYDTKMPWNVDDADLIGEYPVTEDRDYWTDTTFERIRAECQEMRRRVWYDIVAVDKRKKSLTSVLVKVQKFITSIKDKYLPMLDNAMPMQRVAVLMLHTMLGGLHLQVLHRYLFSTTQRMPDRLRQVLIEAGLNQMECSVEWEKRPDLAPWLWYRGAFNQYHAALLLLVEVYAYPMRKEASRIWTCLDFIFEVPSHLAPKQKAELILTDLRDRMETFHQTRKMKVSNQMQQRTGGVEKPHARVPSGVSNDSAVHVQQQNDGITGVMAVSFPPQNFSPPPVQPDSQSSESGSRHGSVGAQAQPQQPQSTDVDMQEIDWVSVPEPNRFKARQITNTPCRPNGKKSSIPRSTQEISTFRISTWPISQEPASRVNLSMITATAQWQLPTSTPSAMRATQLREQMRASMAPFALRAWPTWLM